MVRNVKWHKEMRKAEDDMPVLIGLFATSFLVTFLLLFLFPWYAKYLERLLWYLGVR